MIDLLNVLSGWRAKIVLKVRKRDLKTGKIRRNVQFWKWFHHPNCNWYYSESRKKNTLLSSPFDYSMIDLLNVLSGCRAKIVLKVQKRDLKIEKNRRNVQLKNGFTLQFLTHITPNVAIREICFFLIFFNCNCYKSERTDKEDFFLRPF